jgi:hypothetical protein
MIHDLVLRWVVTGLFALSAAECGLAIATGRRSWVLILNQGLHFVMAVAMVAMAWSRDARFPTTGPAGFFLLAALVFMTVAVFAVRTTAQRGLYGYHGLMMLATAWMFAVMNGHLLPTGSNTQPDTATPGMDMTAMNMPATSGTPIWFSAVNWFGAVGFAVAAVCWGYRYVVGRRHEAARLASLGSVAQTMMAAGMTIFFIAMLFRV